MDALTEKSIHVVILRISQKLSRYFSSLRQQNFNTDVISFHRKKIASVKLHNEANNFSQI